MSGALVLAGFYRIYKWQIAPGVRILDIKLLSESIVFFVTKRSNIKWEIKSTKS